MRGQSARDLASPLVGGLDFGFRSSFAAVWGHLDRDNVLWLTGEHYAREQLLSFHAQHLPRKVTWYADSAGEIAELCQAGFVVRKGNNDLRIGIAAVTARLRAGACPNLLREATLCRWSDEGDSEAPHDADNHALAVLTHPPPRRAQARPRPFPFPRPSRSRFTLARLCGRFGKSQYFGSIVRCDRRALVTLLGRFRASGCHLLVLFGATFHSFYRRSPTNGR